MWKINKKITWLFIPLDGTAEVWKHFNKYWYGAIPYPGAIWGLITSYRREIKLFFQSASFTTEWQLVGKEIITVFSPIFFTVAMNPVITSGSKESRGPNTSTASQQPAIRGFMDNLAVTTPTHVQSEWVLTEIEHIVTRAKIQTQNIKVPCDLKGQTSC